ncbi:MAG: hypothetical protein D6690_06220 [Nitrospirae bacterium]|nr:MAG: hypothetical protein D6690_06220 [Nitrospirota bacterium]
MIIAGITSTKLLVSLYLLLGVLILAVEARRVRSGQTINALTLFNAAYFLFYVFVPLNVLVFGEDAVRQEICISDLVVWRLWDCV